jgi:hypothetical protein
MQMRLVESSDVAPLSATGKMPVPQEIYSLWNGHRHQMLHHCQQQARCLFHKKFILCGTGILPVHKSLIENGATSQI